MFGTVYTLCTWTSHNGVTLFLVHVMLALYHVYEEPKLGVHGEQAAIEDPANSRQTPVHPTSDPCLLLWITTLQQVLLCILLWIDLVS
jgi:hypothetical protein